MCVCVRERERERERERATKLTRITQPRYVIFRCLRHLLPLPRLLLLLLRHCACLEPQAPVHLCSPPPPPPPDRSTAEQVFYTWVAWSRESSSFTALAINKPASSLSSKTISPAASSCRRKTRRQFLSSELTTKMLATAAHQLRMMHPLVV